VQYQFLRRLVYAFFSAEMAVSNLYESGIIAGKLALPQAVIGIIER